jgi:hypothetical protein
MNKKLEYIIICLEIGIELDIDFILFQELYIYKLNNTIISYPAYNIIILDNYIHLRAIIF